MSGIAIITGAGTGIGRSAALALAKRGYHIALAGRRPELLVEAGRLVEAAGGRALPVPTDVTDASSVNALFDKTVQHFGRLDLLFNNAGANFPAVPIDELPVEKWSDVISVNLTGVFLCLRAAFRVMKAQSPQGGRIINNGSVSAHVPRPDSAPYTASKHAVTGLTKCASLDGRPFNIACGQIDVGNAATDMIAAMSKGGLKQADGSIEAEPFMDVEFVGETVAYMASLPISANVQFVTVMATNMPYIGRG